MPPVKKKTHKNGRTPAGDGPAQENAPMAAEIAGLQGRIRELEETLDAIRSGEVDAIVVPDGEDRKIYTLEGPDSPYRNLVENIREGALTLSPDGMILYCNRAFADLRGLPLAGIPGTPFSGHIVPEDRPGLERELRNASAVPARCSVLLCTSDRPIPVQLSLTPLPSVGETRISMVVADRRNDYERLLLQGRMLDEVGDAIVATDPAGNIRFWNDAAAAMYGWKQEEVQGRAISDVIVPEGRKRDVDWVSKKLSTGAWEGETFVRRKDGRMFPIRSRIVPIFDQTGGPLAIIGSSRDITEEKEAGRLTKAASRIDHLLLSGSEYPGIFQKFVSEGAAALGADSAAISLREGDRWVVRYVFGFPDTVIGTEMSDEEEPHAVLALATREPVTIEDTFQDNRVNVAHLKKWGVRSVMAVPVLSAEKAVGVLFFNYSSQVSFNDHQKRFAGSVADSVSLTLDRARILEELRKSEAHFRSVIENSRDVIYRISITSGQYEYISPAAETIVGFSAQELMKLSPDESLAMIHPEDRRTFQKFLDRLEKDGVADAEYRQRAKSGEYRWLSNRVSLIRDDTGRPLFRDGTIRDISKRKAAEEELKKSEERFRELAEKAGSIILRMDSRGRITYFNEFAEKFFGYSRDEILMKPAVGTIVPLTDSCGRNLEAMVQDFLAHPERHAENENENVRKNGERVWVRWMNSPVRNPDGTIREFTSIGIDVTDRRSAEEELAKKNRDLNILNEELRITQEELTKNVEQLTSREGQLQEALAEKEILLSEIHHRVKNNLTAFISLLSLDGSYEKSDAGQMLRKDLQNRARSMALIHETLYRTGKFSSVDMDIYLTTLTGQVAGTYAGSTPVRILVDAKGVVLDLARATTAGLIINELVTNAFKYAFPPGFDCIKERNEPCTVRVEFRSDGIQTRLIVSDNGCGLPPGIDPRAMKSLGLKLVNFLARHQLRAETEVQRDRGTRFIFRLDET
jgi:PAS domain S-box-containing protein